MINERARWIWIHDTYKPNEYAVFEGDFTWNGGKACFALAAETDYVLRINGAVASFGAFAGYPTEKYYDEIDISSLCRVGENRFSLTVRYEGVNSATHIDDGAGVIFSLTEGDALLAYSGTHTSGGLDGRYIQHEVRHITVQLGLTSGMACGGTPSLLPCVEVHKTYNLRPRPVKQRTVGARLPATAVEGKPGIYDLGREETGYLTLTVRALRAGRLTVAYGEHIADGCVRQKVGGRDFSLDFDLTPGEHVFTQYFVRIAGRYLEVHLPEGAEVTAIGLWPTRYPVTEKPFSLDGIDQKIYDTCIRTLRLCMGNHYEDCPWREQGLYVLDARNQMLCGYDAFVETDYARANLVFMAKGKRPDGLLELTYPAINTPAIPFFSLMYPVAVAEYVRYTGDDSILDEVWETMVTILTVFRDRIDGTGLIPELPAPYWNFYEWSDGSNGWGKTADGRYALILNCAYVLAAASFGELPKKTDVDFGKELPALRDAIRANFRQEDGSFRLFREADAPVSQLGNAMALLAGIGDHKTESFLKCNKTQIPATLSTMGFVYDALLSQGGDNREYVLNDIRQKYSAMLAQGATSFWETLEGQTAFDNAGSLCHGWSALPVHYYHRLSDKRE